MGSALIRLEDGILVEVETSATDPQKVSGGLIRHVQASLDQIAPVMTAVVNAVTHAWHEIEGDMDMQTASIELGLSFEGEGTVYIAKAKAGSTLTLKLEFKPKEKATQATPALPASSVTASHATMQAEH
jgi:hypothetical protein